MNEELKQIIKEKENISNLVEFLLKRDISEQDLIFTFHELKSNHSTNKELYQFILSVLKSHKEKCDLLRLDFFNCITNATSDSQDLQLRLNILKLLTNDAKDLKHIEHDAGKLVLEWINIAWIAIDNEKDESNQSNINLIVDLISFMTSLVKYSFIYLDDHAVSEHLALTRRFCKECEILRSSSVSFLDALSKYGVVSIGSLSLFTSILTLGAAQSSSQTSAILLMDALLLSQMSTLFVGSFFGVLADNDSCNEECKGSLILMDHILVKSRFKFFSSTIIFKVCSRFKPFNCY